MDRELWTRVEALFHQALELPSDQRVNFILATAEHDAQLRLEVLTLIQSHETENGFFEQQATPDWSDSLQHRAGSFLTEKENDNTSTADQLSLDRSQERSFPLPEVDANASQLIVSLMQCRPDFEVRGIINRGGMGTVLRVYQKKLNREVAIKLLSTIHVDKQLRRRFIEESKAVAQINSDHVVKIYEVGDDSEIPFLAMELVTGPSLRRFIKTQHQIAPRLAAELTRQIANGLAAAHQQKLIHRDIKPANVLLESLLPGTSRHPVSESRSTDGQHWRAKIIDFGLARSLAPKKGEASELSLAGTLAYMSPEQLLRPNSVDHRCDIYSLGLTLYQMLTGELPFRGAPHIVVKNIETRAPTLPRSFDDRIPRDLESICLKAISKDRERRYSTAQEFSEDLSCFLDGRPTIARPISSLELASRWIARNRKISFLAGLAACLLMLLSIGSLIFAVTVERKNREIVSQREKANQSQVQRIIDTDSGALQAAIDEVIQPDFGFDTVSIQQRLQLQFRDSQNDFNRRFNTAVALARLNSPETDFVVDGLHQLFVNPANCLNVLTALESDPQSVAKLRTATAQTDDRQLKSRQIILLAELGSFDEWQAALADRLDPSLATEIVHAWPNWHGDIPRFLDHVDRQGSAELNWAICQALELLDRRSLNQPGFEAAKNWLSRVYSLANEYAAFAGAEKVLTKWESTLPLREMSRNANWKSLSNGIRMVSITPGTTQMGRMEKINIYQGYEQHEVTITRPFAIADTEITVAQFLEFLADPVCESKDKPRNLADWKYSEIISPTGQHPIQSVNWDDAARFCNWLSRKEGLAVVYHSGTADVSLELDQGDTVKFEHWTIDLEAKGYRLPTEHEFELASRCGSQTKYHYGVQREFFNDYGLASSHTRIPAGLVRSRMSNRNGIFDSIGNVWEWCEDWGCVVDGTPLTDPRGPLAPENNPDNFGRTIRSGGIGTFSGDTDSESRGHQNPASRYENCGFRVARFLD